MSAVGGAQQRPAPQPAETASPVRWPAPADLSAGLLEQRFRPGSRCRHRPGRRPRPILPTHAQRDGVRAGDTLLVNGACPSATRRGPAPSSTPHMPPGARPWAEPGTEASVCPSISVRRPSPAREHAGIRPVWTDRSQSGASLRVQSEAAPGPHRIRPDRLISAPRAEPRCISVCVGWPWGPSPSSTLAVLRMWGADSRLRPSRGPVIDTSPLARSRPTLAEKAGHGSRSISAREPTVMPLARTPSVNGNLCVSAADRCLTALSCPGNDASLHVRSGHIPEGVRVRGGLGRTCHPARDHRLDSAVRRGVCSAGGSVLVDGTSPLARSAPCP